MSRAEERPRGDEPLLTKPLPNDPTAERAVLGAIILDNSLLAEAASDLDESDFYIGTHQQIWRAIVDCADAGQPIDPLTIRPFLGRKSPVTGVMLAELIDGIPRIDHVGAYVARVKRASVRRAKIAASLRLVDRLLDDEQDDIDAVDEEVMTLTKLNTGRRAGYRSMNEGVVETLERLEDRFAGRRPMPLETGFDDLDFATGGLERPDYWVIGGRPSSGKTALALDIAENCARQVNRLRNADGDWFERPVHVGINSIEMAFGRLIERRIAAETGIPTRAIRRTRDLSRHQFTQVIDAGMRLTDLNLHVDENPDITLQQLEAQATAMHARGMLDLLVIDYLQLVKDRKSRTIRERVIEVSHGVKTLGRRLGIPIIALSQLNRESEKREQGKPSVNDLSEADVIYQDADVIALPWRPYRLEYVGRRTAEGDPEPEPCFLILGKLRDGGVCEVELEFIGPKTRFQNRA